MCFPFVVRHKPLVTFGSARPWIYRLIFAGVWCSECSQHILPRTGAGINQAGLLEFLESSAINRQAFALRIWLKRSAAVRSFLPIEPTPFQILIHCGQEFRFASRLIQVLVSQHQHALSFLCPLLRDPERPRMPNVKQACWRGSEASAIQF